MAETRFQRYFNSATQALNRIRPWHKMPRSIGLVILYGLRDRLRRLNLHDTNRLESKAPFVTPPSEPGFIVSRAPEGTHNDLEKPAMGAVGTRFGRNFALDQVYPDDGAMLTPNPRTVSLALLTREKFEPAATLNLLAAAWIQFMVHDWFSHGDNDEQHFFEVALAPQDPWPERPMRIPKTQPDATRAPNAKDGPPTFVNKVTHWWDASQVYGSDRETENRLRSGKDGKLRVGEKDLLPLNDKGVEDTGVTGNFWIGLSMLHTLFLREHNLICDRLRVEYPAWTDQDLYLRARLINAAVLAKIHTVEWTPAILGHPTIKYSMEGGWWGIAGKHITEALGRYGRGDILTGIPGSETEQFSAPYSMTEEFVSVYRMHGLIPDDFNFRSAETNETVYPDQTLPTVSGRAGRKIMTEVSFQDLFYSFGTSHPGALVLHNFPKFLQQLRKDDGQAMDLAAIDILRDRERGVPRYNRFRQLLHMRPVRRFEEITDNADWAEELRQMYNDDVNSVDLMVGLLAESPRPAGFGFCETAFRVFLLMAPRRLKSDRFFTSDYTPVVYTQTGLDWIRDSDFSTILIRHMPALQPTLAHLGNPFAPWPAVKK
jgi:hypothetical protein